MRNLLFIITSVIVFNSSNAQKIVNDYRSAQTENDVFYDGLITEDAYLAAGTIFLDGNQNVNAMLVKMDQSGNHLWTAHFGGQRADIGIGVKAWNTGQYLVVGSSDSLNANNLDPCFWFVSTSGQVDSMKILPMPYSVTLTDMVALSNGNHLLTGYFNKTANDRQALLMMLNSQLDTVWTREYGGALVDDAWGAVETSSGDIIFTGGSYSYSQGTQADLWICKVDASGNKIGQETTGVQDRVDRGWGIAKNSAGQIVVGGFTDGQDSTIGAKGYLVEIDEQLNIQTEHAVSGGYLDIGFTDIIASGDTAWLVTGGKLNTARFDFFMMKVSHDGTILFSRDFGDQQRLNRSWDVTYKNGKYLVVGEVGRNQQEEDRDAFAVAFADEQDTGSSTGILRYKDNPAMKLHPNPVISQLSITGLAPEKAYHYQIYDSMGQRVKAGNFKRSIETADLAPGQYFISVRETNSAKVTTQPFVKKK